MTVSICHILDVFHYLVETFRFDLSGTVHVLKGAYVFGVWNHTWFNDLRVILNTIYHKCMRCPKMSFHHCKLSTLTLNYFIRCIFIKWTTWTHVVFFFYIFEKTCVLRLLLNFVSMPVLLMVLSSKTGKSRLLYLHFPNLHSQTGRGWQHCSVYSASKWFHFMMSWCQFVLDSAVVHPVQNLITTLKLCMTPVCVVRWNKY